MAHVTLPRTSQVGANEWDDVESNDQAIVTQVNGNLDATNLAANAVTTAKITDSNVTTAKIADSNVTTAKIADANVTGAKLAADVVGVYRTLMSAAGTFAPDAPAGTYGVVVAKSGWVTTLTGSTAAGDLLGACLYIDDADYTIAARTTKLRVRAQAAVNATAPGTITYTTGLYPVSVAGAADNLTFTFGAVVAGSTAAIVNPAASTITSAVGSDFSVPADGLYVFGCETNATLANNSRVGISAQLQLHHT